MANTYKALQTVTVGAGGAASIDFTNIPQTYTDLKLVLSLRATPAAVDVATRIRFNSSTSGYSFKQLYGTGSAAGSSSGNADTYLFGVGCTGSSATANTFASSEVVIPNYVFSNYKSASADMVDETNATATEANMFAYLWSNTAAISSITIFPSSGSFVQYSTATLYGVFNQDVIAAPAAPTIGTATAGTESASITFTGVSGAASYTMTSSPGSITGTGTTSPITVSGLTGGTAYTFTCKANNPIGSSASSSASNSVTPYSLAYEFIGAASPTGTTVSFTSIPQTYKHLRLHIVGRSTYTAYDQQGYVTFNSDTGSNYRRRYTLSNGSTPLYASSAAAAYSWALPNFPGSYIDSNNFGSGVCEIFDYSDTSKITTLSGFGGYSYGGYGQSTGYWNNTAAVTRIDIQIANGNWVSGSHFALYGIKG